MTRSIAGPGLSEARQDPAPARMAAGRLRVAAFPSLGALPRGCDALFDAAPPGDFQATRAWYEVVTADALPPGARPCFAVCLEDDRPRALLPLMMLDGGRLQGMSTPYTSRFQPLVPPETGPAALRGVGAALGRFCRRSATLRIDALDADWPGLAPLRQGFRDAGLLVQSFAHFGNWRESVAGLSWQAYLDARPGALRETVRRKTRRAERDGRITWDLVRSPDGLEPALAAYEAVYRRSWKEPEPFPRFNPGLMRRAAAEGVLRLGVLRVEGQPAAAQYWILHGGQAVVMKLAHDEAYKPLSPGTVLTAWMIRAMLERERVETLDFGRGDDPYKQLWAGLRRQHIGVVLVNPWRPAGTAAAARHLLARAWRAARPVARPQGG